MRTLAIAVLAIGMPLAAAEECPSADSMRPPTQQLLRVKSASEWQLIEQVVAITCRFEERAITVEVPVTIEIAESVDGKPVKKLKTEKRQQSKTIVVSKPFCTVLHHKRTFDPNQIRAYDIHGKPMTTDEVAGR